MSFSVYYTTYYDNTSCSYKNILTLNETPNDLLKPYTKNVKFNDISPFQTNNTYNNYNKCVHAFIDSNNNFIDLNDLTSFINILNIINYSIDYDATNLLINSKLIPKLVFIIKQN